MARPHPCLAVPLAEQRRLLLAAHLALHDMLADKAQGAWMDLPAAVAVAAEVLDGLDLEGDARRAVQRAGEALVSTAGLPTPTDEAKSACGAFLPYYEGILAAVTWRRLIEAQHATAAAWRAAAR
jgi:hypothetical protein